jgi:hypothetical protein
VMGDAAVAIAWGRLVWFLARSNFRKVPMGAALSRPWSAHRSLDLVGEAAEVLMQPAVHFPLGLIGR